VRRPTKPWLDGLPRLIFVNDMGDGFTASVHPDDWLTPKLGRIAPSPHQWLFLTKRIDRFAEYADRHALPPNVWAGVSVPRAQAARLRILKRVRVGLRFVSFEPLREDLGPLDLGGISWAIVGGESGPRFEPCEVDWIGGVVEQCRAQGVPVFVKQDAGRWPGRQGRIPAELWVREFPRFGP
jgi:protein gp37